MSKQDDKTQDNQQARPFARASARELTQVEIDKIAGGVPKHTMSTGVNGDDPGDPPK